MINFLKTSPKFKNYYENSQVLLYLDNASINCRNIDLNEYGDHHVSIFYNCPYLCVFKAIDVFFSYLKRRMKKYTYMNNFDVIERARIILSNFEDHLCHSAVLKSLENVMDEIRQIVQDLTKHD